MAEQDGRKSTHVQVRLSVDGGEDDPLGAIRGIAEGTRNIEMALRDVVRQARRMGNSWQEIADALGISRQAAWERFQHLDREPEDVISQVLGSLAGPGPTTDEMRRAGREEDEEIERRRSSRTL